MDPVLYERNGPVAVITFNQPDKMNALDYEANQLLLAHFHRFSDDPDARVLVVTGAGDKAFSAGADMKTFSLAYATRPAPFFREHFIEGYGFGGITRNLKINKPIIGAINGYAIGGGFELSLAMDIRFCSPNAEFACQDVLWGMHPCDGGCVRLPKIVGMANAMEIILGGERIGADRAMQMGLVNRIIPQDRLLAETMAYAEHLATRGPLAQEFVKDVAYRAPGLSLTEALRLELRSFTDLAHSEDFVEGVTSFRERRAPCFAGK